MISKPRPPFGVQTGPNVINGLAQGRDEKHTDCCPALALWILGQADMARQAAAECEAVK